MEIEVLMFFSDSMFNQPLLLVRQQRRWVNKIKKLLALLQEAFLCVDFYLTLGAKQHQLHALRHY